MLAQMMEMEEIVLPGKVKAAVRHKQCVQGCSRGNWGRGWGVGEGRPGSPTNLTEI